MHRRALVRLAITLAGLFAPVAWSAWWTAFPPLADAARPAAAARITPELAAQLATLPPEEKITAIVRLRSQPPPDPTAAAVPSVAERAIAVRQFIESRRALARASQAELLALLRSPRLAGDVAEVVPFWLFNGLAVTATAAVIAWPGPHPAVAALEANRVFVAPRAAGAAATAATAVAPNLAVIGAPTAWRLAARGRGAVVATMDTGVHAGHPDLASRWRGGSNSWFDPHGEHPETPIDLAGHGTQVMGVLVGGSAGGSAIGMAPEATWIAVKLFDDAGRSTSVAIHQGFQWLLDPDGDPATRDEPQVVNGSWAFGGANCDAEFRGDVQALAATGIAVVFAAGNYCPAASTDVSPANYPESLAVGASDNADAIWLASSRGPTSCGDNVERTYPGLAAPGVDVRSADQYGSSAAASGTSLAAPHVAGALALLHGADPSLTLAEKVGILLATAVDRGAPGPDNAYGFGRLDAGAAVGTLVLAPRRQQGVLRYPGSAIYALAVRNASPQATTFSLGARSECGCRLDLPPEVAVAAWSAANVTLVVAAPCLDGPGADTTTVTTSPSAGGPAAVAIITTHVVPPHQLHLPVVAAGG